MAWYKVLNPEGEWDKISLEGVEHMADLKKTIKKDSPRKLDTYDANDLIPV